ncbi:MAG: hypothetical protein E7J72_05355 [Veillonella sp.]|nr:hypothetical protein [Veillonella sp.]
MLSIELKILICFIWAFIVFFITALIIGNKGKAKWFQQRTKYSWFNRRGFLGEICHWYRRLYFIPIITISVHFSEGR